MPPLWRRGVPDSRQPHCVQKPVAITQPLKSA